MTCTQDAPSGNRPRPPAQTSQLEARRPSRAMPCPVRSTPALSCGAPWWKKTARLRLGGVLAAQVMIGLQERPAFQDLRRRDPALREPAIGQQLPQVPGVGLVSLGTPLAATGGRPVSRLGGMRGASGRGQLPGGIPPPGAPLQRERDIVTAGEPRQPGPQVNAVNRGDLAAPDLPGHGAGTVEGQLLPVDIQPAYDGHRDPPQAPQGAQAPVRELLTQLIVTPLSWGDPPGVAATRGTHQLSR
jgi:hypothetical protein